MKALLGCKTGEIAIFIYQFNPLNADSTKWSNTLKQFVGNLPTNCFSVFDRFVGLALKGLRYRDIMIQLKNFPFSDIALLPNLGLAFQVVSF